MPFVFEAAGRLDTLQSGAERARVEASIRSISASAVMA
jgi:hypothetical protein